MATGLTTVGMILNVSKEGESSPLGVTQGSQEVDADASTDPLITLCVPLLMFATGVLGNVMALVLLWRSRRDHSRSVFYRLVAGLALTDLLGTLATSPVTLLVYSNDRQWVGGQAVCSYFSFMMIFAGLATVLVVGSLAVERFLAILHPYTYERQVSPKRANCTLVGIWLVSMLVSCLPLVKVGRNVPHWPGTWCFFDYYSQRTADKGFAFFFAIIGLLVIAATAICNIAVMVVLLRMRRISQNIGKSREGRTLNMTSEMQMIFFLAGIILVFAACYSPLMVRIILIVVGVVKEDLKWDLLAIRLASVNQILDPWVYLLFRRRLAALLYSTCKSVSPLHTLSSLKALRTPELIRNNNMKVLNGVQSTEVPNGPDSSALPTSKGSVSPAPLSGSDSPALHTFNGSVCPALQILNGFVCPAQQTLSGSDSTGLRLPSGPESLGLPSSSTPQDVGQMKNREIVMGIEPSSHSCSSREICCKGRVKDDSSGGPVKPDKGLGDMVVEWLLVVEGNGQDNSFSRSFLLNGNSCSGSSDVGRELRKVSCENAALSLEGDDCCSDDAGNDETGQCYRHQASGPQLVVDGHSDGHSFPVNKRFRNTGKKTEELGNKVLEKTAVENRQAVYGRGRPAAAQDQAADENNEGCELKRMSKNLKLSPDIPTTNLGKRMSSKDTQLHSAVAKLTTSASWPVICRHGNKTIIKKGREEETEVTDCLPVRNKRHSHRESDCFPLLQNKPCSPVGWPCQQCRHFIPQPFSLV